MNSLRITFPDNENEPCENADPLATCPQAVFFGHEAFRILRQLNPSRRAKYLEEVNRYGSGVLFDFHDYADSNSDHYLSNEEWIRKYQMTEDTDDHSMDGPGVSEKESRSDSTIRTDVISVEPPVITPPVDTSNPTVLDEPIVELDSVDNMLRSDAEHAISDADQSTPDEEPSSFSVPSISPSQCLESFGDHISSGAGSIVADSGSDECSMRAVNDLTELREGSPGSETSLENIDLSSVSSADSHSEENSDIETGLSTPPSDIFPTKEPREAVSGTFLAQTKAPNAKRRNALEQDSEKSSKRSKILNLPASVPSRLRDLEDQDIQNSIECCKGLVRDDLPVYIDQHFATWKEQSFWSEILLRLSFSGHSTVDRAGHLFQHTHALEKRKLDEKLKRRLSKVMFHLTFESLVQEIAQEGKKKPRTIAVEHLLKNAHAEKWDSMPPEEKGPLRTSLHDYKRTGSRWLRAAGVLGLGVLLASGDTLTTITTSHSKFPTKTKFDLAITYIWKAHPGFVSICHDLDGLTKQILCGEPITEGVAKQAFDEKIRQMTATSLSPQQVEQNWQFVDCDAESQKLLKQIG